MAAKMRISLVVLVPLMVGVTGCTTTRNSLPPHYPPAAEAEVAAYFSYPFRGPKSAWKIDRPGPGFEVHAQNLDKGEAALLIIPNGAEPKIRFLEADQCREILKRWEKLNLFSYQARDFQQALAPFDERTLVIVSRVGGQAKRLEIYAPDSAAQELASMPAGRALQAFLDFLYQIVGEGVL